MIYKKGNLLDSKAEAIVNTVNTVGVMGKGIALQFKETFSENYKAYLNACKQNLLVPGKLLVFKESMVEGDRIIINFPTKIQWFQKSSYEYIEKGLQELLVVIKHYNISSIAIPPLGCGNGGLKWDKVKYLMEKYLKDLKDVSIEIYEPNDEVKEILKKQVLNKEIKLTPARAMLMYAMFYYESLDENVNLFVANKLAYLLQRLGEKSLKKLKFERGKFGPYSVQVQHLLYQLNGKYIKGLEQMDVKPFESIELQYDKLKEISYYVKTKLTHEQYLTLKNLVKLIDGFQSAFALEILTSVDFIRKDKSDITDREVFEAISKWSNRKKELFKERYISITTKHLDEYKSKLSFN